MTSNDTPKMRLVAAHARLASALADADKARAIIERGEPPFKVGDIVELKSGGVPMMVEQVDQRCGDELWTVHVVWTAAKSLHEIPRDSLPASCLRLAELASDGRPVRKLHIDDDLPF